MFDDRLPAPLLRIEIARTQLQRGFTFFQVRRQAELIVQLTQAYTKNGKVVSAVVVDDDELEAVGHHL